MKTVEAAPRVALSNCTNSSRTITNPPNLCPLKRRVSTEYSCNNKRPKVVNQAASYDQRKVQIPDDSMQVEFTGGGQQNCTAFHALRAARTWPRRNFHCASLSSRPILASFVSSHKCDVYRLHARDDPIAPGLPFACAFTGDAKRGGVPVLAVATQDGTVELLNVRKRQEWEIEPQRTTIQVHNNAILDAKWRMDDQYLATSSGDSTTRITCVATQQSLAVLAHHTSSVKSLDWNPDHSDVLSTASRDGSICVWDLRTAPQGDTTDNSSALAPVVVLPHAHCDVKPRGKTAKSTSVKTVTSVLHLPQNPQQLISSGSFDGVLKQWDLRYPINGRAQKPVMLFESYNDPTLTTGSRARGLSGLALGRNHSSSLLWGIAADSCIHTYTLPLSAPSDALTPNKLSHPGLFVKSFYVKLATSPCGSWLASGSSGGGVYLWDVASRSSNQGIAVELNSAGREAGAVDWGSDSLAACCDDGTVRIWRPNQEVSIMCKADPEEHTWNWAWATEN